PALLWGVALANIVAGVPLDAENEYVGGVVNLLNPFALLGGLVTVTLFATHGAIFVALKTVGDIRARARRFAGRTGLVALLALAAFTIWYGVAYSNTSLTWLTIAIAIVAMIGGLSANARGREGWAFVGTAATILATVVTLFLGLFPQVMPSTLDPAFSLDIGNASSTPYTLSIMTVAAAIFTPIVLLYQGWTYWVFRKRIGVQHMPDPVA
ncbi:MAG: cytochrome d ubiquinol oxidase subunit II, partial [Propionibacteriales bacterium]|nr:cytochrome d ubiquinol oxidase subunit II [Propionibacteriales bacterium]